MAEEKPKVEEVKTEYKLVEVPTQFGIAIQTPEETTISTEQALVLILNQVSELRKAL